MKFRRNFLVNGIKIWAEIKITSLHTCNYCYYEWKKQPRREVAVNSTSKLQIHYTQITRLTCRATLSK